jgi:hypothetical protein
VVARLHRRALLRGIDAVVILATEIASDLSAD